MSKAAEKIRNLSAEELKHEEKLQMDQLFRLKFQMKMGQSESLNKIRTLRRNVARMKTFRRQHELGIATSAVAPKTEAAPKAKKTSSRAASKSTKKTTAGKAGKK